MSQQKITITSNKISALKIPATSIKQFIQQNPSALTNANQITQIRIMHCKNLSSLQGIQIFVNLQKLNVSNNQLTSLNSVAYLVKLQEINVSTNHICSLKPLENCRKLLKINASHNLIKDFLGFQKAFDNLQFIDLSGNRLQNLNGIKFISKNKNLKQLWFKKKNNITNPICQNRTRYISTLYQNKLLQNLIKIDGISPMELIKQLHIFNDKSQEQNSLSMRQNYNQQNFQKNQNYQEGRNQRFHPQYQYTQTRKHHAKSINNNKNQQRVKQLQDVINFKEEIIDQLRNKLNHLQIQNSQQFKQILRKDNQIERLSSQLSQYGRQIQIKQTKLSQTHNKLQQMSEARGVFNKTVQLKNQQLQKINRQICDLKVENAKFQALNKDYQKRLSDLHEKALKNVQQSTTKNQQLKRKCQLLYDQNRDLVKDINQCKNRIRQLTELLRQYQFKFEAKKNQMQNRFNFQKAQIIRQYQDKQHDFSRIQDQQKRKWTAQMKDQVQQIQQKYKTALQQTMIMYKNTKKQLDEKCSLEHQLTSNVKSLSQKNMEQQKIIQQLQSVLLKLRQQVVQIINDKQRLQSQLYSIKANKGNHIKILNDQVAKLQYQRTVMDKQLQSLRSQNYLQKQQIDSHQKLTNQLEDKQKKLEQLNHKVQVQNVMIQDKNQSIQSLKQQIDFLKDEKNSLLQSQKNLSKKYQKQKQKRKQIESQFLEACEELQNKQLMLNQKQQNIQRANEQVSQFQKIIQSLNTQIQQKNNDIEKLTNYLTQCRGIVETQKIQAQQLRRQQNRCENQLKEIQYKNRRQISEIKSKYQIQIRKVMDQSMAMKQKLGQFKNLMKSFDGF